MDLPFSVVCFFIVYPDLTCLIANISHVFMTLGF